MKNNNKLSPVFSKSVFWLENNNSVWLGSSIKLKRNIEKFNFPGKLGTDRKNQIISLCTKEIVDTKLLQGPTVLKAEDMTPLEKEFLVEHFISSQLYHQASSGEAFIIDEPGEFMIALNVRNHLQFELLDKKGELENSLNKIVKAETAIGKSLSYCYLPKYGFLTADPSECGTGLLATSFLQLSALIHTEVIDDMLEKYADDSISITGLQGNPTDIVGDIIAVHNNYTLGLSEENIISTQRNFVTKILLEENSARSKIRSEESSSIKDKVSRAFGILIHSYQIEAIEALNAISLLKLGADLGWLEGIDTKGLNQLFFNCRRSHLLCLFPEKISQDKIPHKRAEFIHSALKDVKLVI